MVIYILESIGPELRQYLVANDKEEMPFNRDERSWVYATAKQQRNTFGFGTTELIYGTGYPILKHHEFPFPDSSMRYHGDDPTSIPCIKIAEKHMVENALTDRHLLLIFQACHLGLLVQKR